MGSWSSWNLKQLGLLQVVADFCAWSGMRIKRENLNSVVTRFDFRLGTDFPTAGILPMYEGAPLIDLAAEEAFAYLGVRTSLVGMQRRRLAGKRRWLLSAPCLSTEKSHPGNNK